MNGLIVLLKAWFFFTWNVAVSLRILALSQRFNSYLYVLISNKLHSIALCIGIKYFPLGPSLYMRDQIYQSMGRKISIKNSSIKQVQFRDKGIYFLYIHFDTCFSLAVPDNILVRQSAMLLTPLQKLTFQMPCAEALRTAW